MPDSVEWEYTWQVVAAPSGLQVWCVWDIGEDAENMEPDGPYPVLMMASQVELVRFQDDGVIVSGSNGRRSLRFSGDPDVSTSLGIGMPFAPVCYFVANVIDDEAGNWLEQKYCYLTEKQARKEIERRRNEAKNA